MRSLWCPETQAFGKHDALEKGRSKSPHICYLLQPARGDLYCEDLDVSWNLRYNFFLLFSDLSHIFFFCLKFTVVLIFLLLLPYNWPCPSWPLLGTHREGGFGSCFCWFKNRQVTIASAKQTPSTRWAYLPRSVILCSSTKDFSPKAILPNISTAFSPFHFKSFERRANFIQFVIMKNWLIWI